MSNTNTFSETRSIRVFISSTFRDMMRERDLLVKEVFPELRRKCAKRFVTFTEVDLRWGITEEQANEGQVLPLCLAEIERSRPFFIGLLGERYGWIPQNIRPDILEREPWLAEHIENRTSVTELEILHGVLNNPTMHDHAFFYFRNPEYINSPSLTPEQRKEMTEHNLLPELKNFDETEVNRLTRQRKEKLLALKERIRSGKFHLVENYANPETLAKVVLEQFEKLIDELYPLSAVPDPLIQERMDHEAHAKNKLFACINRPAHLKALDSFAKRADREGKGLVITGESGCGKTALLAAWVQNWSIAHPNDFIFQHYFGATADSASAEKFLRRLLGELKESFGIKDEIPNEPEKLKDTLSIWLAETSGKGSVILVLDGLNQVKGTEAEQRLNFLPRFFPENVVILTSALPSAALDDLGERHWIEYDLPPASEIEIDAMAGEYLKIYGRYLDQEGLSIQTGLRRKLVNAPGSANPLFLRTMLDEIRLFGSFEQLPLFVEHYLEAKNSKDLFIRVLNRWQEDFDGKNQDTDKPKTDLVRRALSCLWSARQGLSETEWLELMGNGEGPLPRVHWSPFFNSLEPHLSQHNGLFAFGHDFLRQAVEEKFLSSDGLQHTAHLVIADYFDHHLHQQEMTPRKAAEWPYQLKAAQEWNRLADCLSNIPLFLALYTDNKKWELTNYWIPILQISKDIGIWYIDAYRHLKRKSINCSKHNVSSKIGQFLLENGQLKDADAFLLRALWSRFLHFKFKHSDTLKYWSDWAELVERKGKVEVALTIHRRILKIRKRTLGLEHPDTLKSMDILSFLMINIHTAEAEQLSRTVLEVRERSLGPDHIETLESVSHLALVLSSLYIIFRGNWDSAKTIEMESLLQRAVDGRERVLGLKHPDTLKSKNNLAGYLYLKGDIGSAEKLLRHVLSVEEQLLGPEHPNLLMTLLTLADLLRNKGDYSGAELLLRKSLNINMNLVGIKHQDTKNNIDDLAHLLELMGRDQEARSLRMKV